MFIKHTNGSNVTIPLVYVNDIIVTKNGEIGKGGLKDWLTHEFEELRKIEILHWH